MRSRDSKTSVAESGTCAWNSKCSVLETRKMSGDDDEIMLRDELNVGMTWENGPGCIHYSARAMTIVDLHDMD